MRKIIYQSKSKTLTQKDLYNVLYATEDHPKWAKFCKSVTVTEKKVSAIYHDVTTLLWIPLKIKHIFTKIEPYEEIQVFLPLPFGGKMWHTSSFKQQEKEALMYCEVAFDLGNRFLNATVGHILEKRWEELFKQGFPGLEETKRLQSNHAKQTQ